MGWGKIEGPERWIFFRREMGFGELGDVEGAGAGRMALVMWSGWWGYGMIRIYESGTTWL